MKSIIYKVVCSSTKKIYIGSTNKTLDVRLTEHNNHINPTACKDFVNKTIHLLEEFDCNNFEEQLIKEQEWMDKTDCVNINRAHRTEEYSKKYHYEYNKKWRKNNPDKKKLSNDKYRNANKDDINSKRRVNIVCKCGKEINKYTVKRHEKSKRHIKYINST